MKEYGIYTQEIEEKMELTPELMDLAEKSLKKAPIGESKTWKTHLAAKLVKRICQK
ncbi:MAG TPA: hypothetical protein VF189_04275 [Patescibacteria group bacterium]